MRRRQITTVEWHMQFTTNIRVQSAGYGIQPYIIDKFSIVSGDIRSVHVNIGINGLGMLYLEPKKAVLIISRLKKSIRPSWAIRHIADSDNIQADFPLGKDEEFCDGALRIGRLVMDALGVRYIPELFCQFSIRQETEVYMRGRWMSFADHIRLKHGLPLPSEF